MRCFGSKIPSKTSKKTTNSTIKSRFYTESRARNLKTLKKMISFVTSCAQREVIAIVVARTKRIENNVVEVIR